MLNFDESCISSVTLFSYFNKNWDVVSKEDVSLSTNETRKDILIRDQVSLLGANQNAIITAYNYANVPYSLTNKHNYIIYISEESDTDLKVGDELLKVDNITVTDITSVANIIDNKNVQNFVIKHNFNPENVARNMSVITDVVLTASSAIRTMKSNKIKEERKRPLIYNNIISTGLSVLGGCYLDKLAQKGSKNFIAKFTEANKNDPKLAKYIQGLNVVRPTLIFAIVYYGILPMFSSFFAEKLDNIQQKHCNKIKPQ